MAILLAFAVGPISLFSQVDVLPFFPQYYSRPGDVLVRYLGRVDGMSSLVILDTPAGRKSSRSMVVFSHRRMRAKGQDLFVLTYRGRRTAIPFKADKIFVQWNTEEDVKPFSQISYIDKSYKGVSGVDHYVFTYKYNKKLQKPFVTKVVLSAHDGSSLTTKFSYNSKGKVTKVFSGSSRKAYYKYDKSSRLVQYKINKEIYDLTYPRDTEKSLVRRPSIKTPNGGVDNTMSMLFTSNSHGRLVEVNTAYSQKQDERGVTFRKEKTRVAHDDRGRVKSLSESFGSRPVFLKRVYIFTYGN